MSTMSFTVYRAKLEVDDPLSLISTPATPMPVIAGGKLIGDLFLKNSDPKTPRWTSFFASADNLAESIFGTSSTVSAVLLVIPKDRPFVLTFGYGRSMLNLDKFEDDFGLRISLNSIRQNSVKSIDKQTFDAIAKQSREQASKDVDPRQFGLDVEDDLLRAVVGTPSDPWLGQQVYGRDSLHVAGLELNLTDLPGWLERLSHAYSKTSYLDKFPWVENIRSVKDKNQIDDLDRELVRRLNTDDPGMIWLAAPDILDWEQVCGFTYAETDRKPVLFDMHLKTYRDLWGQEVRLRHLHTRWIGAVNGQDFVIKHWSTYRCIHAEMPVGDVEYLLTNGKWYRVSRDLVATVDSAFEKIPHHDVELPTFGHRSEKTEPAYNKLACENRDDLVCMDSQLVSRGGGRSAIELCDILTSNGNFIHVKRYSGSSDLSHLFAQGSISGQLFATDEEFRKQANALLPKEYRINFDRHMPRDRYGIIFAIVSRSQGPLRPPFFSRLNLKNASQLLTGMGFDVFLKKIEVEGTLKIIQAFTKTPKKRPPTS